MFSNSGAWGLGVLHRFRAKHPDWQLAEWSFRWNRGTGAADFLALLEAGIRSGSATRKDIAATEA